MADANPLIGRTGRLVKLSGEQSSRNMKGAMPMTRKIIVADRDPVYAQALARRIQKHCPACNVATASDEPSFQTLIASSAGDLSLVVSVAQFPVDNLPSGVSQLILLDTRIEPEDLRQPTRPVRLGPVQPILDRLDLAEAQHGQPPLDAIGQASRVPPERVSGEPAEHLFDLRPEPDAVQPAGMIQSAGTVQPTGADKQPSDVQLTGDVQPRDNVLPAGDARSEDSALPAGVDRAEDSAPPEGAVERPHRVILLLTQTIFGRHPVYADQRCQELSRSGAPICYLPLLPNFCCRQAPESSPENGFGLTDLLLRIAGGGLVPADLGAYLAIDGFGRLQVRPTDRADDLLDCRAHDLFQLVMLLRERILIEPQTLLVIEAASIPFRLVQAIVPLCESVEIIMPEDKGFAGQALRREFGEILVELPATARLSQVSEQALLRRSSPGVSAIAATGTAASVPTDPASSAWREPNTSMVRESSAVAGNGNGTIHSTRSAAPWSARGAKYAPA